MHKAVIQLTYKPTHDNLRKTIKAPKNITHQRHSKLEKHSESGSKITLHIKCLIRATLKLTRYFAVKL